MLKGFLAAIGIVLWAGTTTNHGCQDLKTSLTKLSYYPIRDMRRTVALAPQKGSLRPPDSLSVPVSGGERMPDPALLMTSRDLVGARYTSPTAPDDSSVARGARMFTRLCALCHGATLKGDGPVAARFMPPPDLLNAQSRGRSDGYIYTYIRFGGPIMPKYGHALTEHETWDVIHYLRRQQRQSPR